MNKIRSRKDALVFGIATYFTGKAWRKVTPLWY